MFPASHSSVSQFSFDQLASEVNAIVEDLRWLHLELTLRNRCNEVLFQDSASVNGLFESAFGNLREKLGVLELSIYIRGKSSFMVAFRDQEPEMHWLQDHTPWVDALNRWFESQPRETSLPSPVVNHYTVDGEPVTTIAMPVLLQREYAAAMLIVLETSNIVPRLKKLLSGLSGSISLSIDYVRNKLDSMREPVSTVFGSPFHDLTHPIGNGNGSSTHTDEVGAMLALNTAGMPAACLLESDGRVLHINERMESEAGILRGWAVGKSFLDVAVPDRERDRVQQHIMNNARPYHAGGRALAFPLKTADGRQPMYAWFVSPIHQNSAEEQRLMCMGLPFTDENESTAVSESPVVVTEALETRLSKQYRFLMKYVPFPVFHLDASRDIIRNANRPFETVVGATRWEGMPLGDFGTLTVHAAASDTHPCTFQVLSANGITLTYHGIVTPLLIHGKTIREVTLEPVDSSID